MRMRIILVLAVGVVAAACGDDAPSAADRGDCPVDPVRVVVTVDQWGDTVERLGGDCAEVTTIITGSSADPHDYEPSPADVAAFEDAQLVVRNGLGYDGWANRAIATLDRRPVVVDAGNVADRSDGDNPHVWYSPEVVRNVAGAVTSQLARLAPGATDVVERLHAEWVDQLAPYDAEIAAVAQLAAGKSYAATEPVFDGMAAAVGLTDATPPGYRDAALNESDPAPGDIAAFERAVERGEVDVLIDNTQTEGPTPSRLRDAAEHAGVPVVEVSETLPPGVGSFVEWQVDQLSALRTALGG